MSDFVTPSFTIILVESALETLKFLFENKKTQQKARQKRTRSSENTLLDVSDHNHLMNELPDKNKRGRPDIVHTALLLALGSRLNKKGYLQIYVHTRNNEVITFNPEVRIPRNYKRFVGLMEQLFRVKKVPPNASQTLISISNHSLEGLVQNLEPNLVLLFTEKGTLTDNKKIQEMFLKNRKVVILIGAFPHGDISQAIFNLSDIKLSIYPESLDTLVVLSNVIQNVEQSLELMNIKIT